VRLSNLIAVGAALSATTSLTQTEAQVVPLPTAQTALVGRFAQGPFDLPLEVGASQFQQIFGSNNLANWPAEVQARQFFAQGGSTLFVVRVSASGPLDAALVGQAGS